MSGFKINISTLKSGASERLTFDLMGVLPEDGYSAEVAVFGSIEGDGKDYRLKGSISGNVTTGCARCLRAVSFPYEAEIDFDSRDSGGGFEAVSQIEGNYLDIEAVIAGTIRADIPISILCSEDCKGLCQVCGCDLNKVSCGCQKNLTNPVIDLTKFTWNND